MIGPSVLTRILLLTISLVMGCLTQSVAAQGFIVTFADSFSDNLYGRTVYRFGRTNNAVMRSDHNGFNMEAIATPTRLIGMSHSPTEIFFLDWRDNDGQIYFSRVNGDGTPVSDSPIFSFSRFFDVPSTRIYVGLSTIYWGVDGEIAASDLDGNNYRNIYSEEFDSAYCAQVFSVPTLGDQLYIFDGADRDIKIMNLDGTNRTPVGTLRGSFSTSCLAFDGNGSRIYWTDDFGEEIRRANATGGGQSTIITGLDGARDPVFDSTNNKLIWSEFGRIRRSDPDGSNIEDLHTGFSEAPILSYLDDSGLQIYWTVDDTTQRSDLDGDNVEMLFDQFFLGDFEQSLP